MPLFCLLRVWLFGMGRVKKKKDIELNSRITYHSGRFLSGWGWVFFPTPTGSIDVTKQRKHAHAFWTSGSSPPLAAVRQRYTGIGFLMFLHYLYGLRHAKALVCLLLAEAARNTKKFRNIRNNSGTKKYPKRIFRIKPFFSG
jgi:hypothetical protein